GRQQHVYRDDKIEKPVRKGHRPGSPKREVVGGYDVGFAREFERGRRPVYTVYFVGACLEFVEQPPAAAAIVKRAAISLWAETPAQRDAMHAVDIAVFSPIEIERVQ